MQVDSESDRQAERQTTEMDPQVFRALLREQATAAVAEPAELEMPEIEVAPPEPAIEVAPPEPAIEVAPPEPEPVVAPAPASRITHPVAPGSRWIWYVLDGAFIAVLSLLLASA